MCSSGSCTTTRTVAAASLDQNVPEALCQEANPYLEALETLGGLPPAQMLYTWKIEIEADMRNSANGGVKSNGPHTSIFTTIILNLRPTAASIGDEASEVW